MLVRDVVNFRLPAEQKQALTRLATERDTAVSELVREAVEHYLADEERCAWEGEARRASLALADEAKDPASDQARTLKVLDANLEEFGEEWVWDEES